MNDLFPFYVLINEHMKIVNVGRSQVKLGIISKGDNFLSVFSIERPLNISCFNEIKNISCFGEIIRHKSSLFIIVSKQNNKHKFRGQIYYDKPSKLLCFLGSPLVNSFEEIEDFNLSLEDFAIFDNINQFLFTLQMQMSSINDSKRIAEKLRIYKDQLELSLEETKRAKENQQSFFAKMNHELRTPLNAIIGMGELLKNTKLDEEQQKYLSAVSFSSNALLYIINDILDFSKLKSDQFSLENIPFNIKKIIKDVYHSSKYEALEKDLELSYFVSDDIICCIGDPLRISQVLINLVNNAIKFTETGTIKIRVELKSESTDYQNIMFSVTDSGKGINKEKVDGIFNSYTQEDEGITRKYGGTGLGLTIAQEIVKNYNSRINVDTKEGQGACFYFELNLKKFVETEPEKIEPVTIDHNFDGVKVLLVEDNEINRFYAETILTQKNSVVSIAVNGREAVEKVKSNTYDIVLMDMQMPILNGLDATKEIRTILKSDVPIIGLSANIVQGDIKNCYDVGMNGYITKPFEPHELYNKIMEILNLKHEIPKNDRNLESKASYSLDQIKTVTNNNPKLIIKMLEMFIDKIPSDIELMKTYLENEKFERLFALVHKTKPSFNIFGIDRAEDLFQKIEKFDLEQPKTKLLKNYLSELEKIVETVQIGLKKDLQKIK